MKEGTVRSVATATVFVSLFLLLFPPALLLAADSAGQSTAELVTRVTEPALKSGRACEVLWDLTHGPYGGNTPTGGFSNMADTLAAYGYASSTTSAGVHNIDLTSYDVLVIATLMAWTSAYTAEEVTAIEAFVADGGAIFLMGENTGCPNVNINPVSVAFGTTCAVGDPFDTITDLSPHEIFDGITTITLVACGELSVTGATVEAAWDYYGDPVISLLGDCDVVTVGDGNFATNSYFGNDDNKQFVLNAFFLLCGSDSPVEENSWGAIKALYR